VHPSGTIRARKRSRRAPAGIAAALCALTVLAAAACGYHVAGRGSRLPQGWKTIAIPALENKTLRYRIEQRLTEAVVREMLARTKYRVVSNPDTADAVVRGEVSSIDTTAVLFDATTGRATTVLVAVRLKVRLEETGSGRVVWQNDDYLFREEYEVSTDVASFFDEQNPALDRLAADFAAAFVAALLENF